MRDARPRGGEKKPETGTTIEGAAAVAGTTGMLVTLVLTIKDDAPPGDYSITRTSAGTPGLPASDLVLCSGERLPHEFLPGGVTVLAENSVTADWMLYP
jgi:hypothetical protein